MTQDDQGDFFFDGISSFTAGGGSTTATVANFFDSEGVTYCLDSSTLPCTSSSVSGWWS